MNIKSRHLVFLAAALAVLAWAKPTPIRLRVTPRLGIAPLVVRASASSVAPERDHQIEVVALEGELVIRRSERELDGGARAWLDATWTLPAGAYVIGACLWPSGRCTSTTVTVE